LGTIDRPRQIAFVTLADRVLYDFRTNKARVASGGWLRLDNMSAADRNRVNELIHYWERIKLARVTDHRATSRPKGEG
jgi:hypothetical protein